MTGPTRVVHLIRHADAVPRASWSTSDRLRPLTVLGSDQSTLLADRLAARPIRRLVSSPYLRCVDTLEPLALRLGKEVEAREYLAEGRDIARVIRQLFAAVAGLAPGDELAACSHGDIVPFVVDELVDAGAQLEGGRSSPKAVTFLIAFEGEHATRIVRTSPPRP